MKQIIKIAAGIGLVGFVFLSMRAKGKAMPLNFVFAFSRNGKVLADKYDNPEERIIARLEEGLNIANRQINVSFENVTSPNFPSVFDIEDGDLDGFNRVNESLLEIYPDAKVIVWLTDPLSHVAYTFQSIPASGRYGSFYIRASYAMSLKSIPVIAHETGHVLGLNHHEGMPCVMNATPKINSYCPHCIADLEGLPYR